MEGDDSLDMNNQHVYRFNNVDELAAKCDKLEERVNFLQQFFIESHTKHSSYSKNASNGKEIHIPGIKKLQIEASRRELAANKRMQDLMRQFGSLLHQFTQDKWAWPFMQPVDVEGLGLHDYYKVIDRPMDFRTIKNQMEAIDGTGYKNVREIYSDVILIFENAMKYNDENSDVHVMAKSLLSKFEEKWEQFVEKVNEEEARRVYEENEAQMHAQLLQEAVHVKLGRELSNEVEEFDIQVDDFKDTIAKQCRKISSEEKRKLGMGLTKLSPEDLSRALQIVAQNNPRFHLSTEEVDLDISMQSEATLWRLKVFIKDVLEAEGKNIQSGDEEEVDDDESDNKSTRIEQKVVIDPVTNGNYGSTRHKRKILFDDYAKATKKRK